MVTHTYGPTTWEMEAAASQDCAIAFQPGWQSKNPVQGKKKKDLDWLLSKFIQLVELVDKLFSLEN